MIKKIHLFFGEHLPTNFGENIRMNCGARISYQGFVPKDMIDHRKCEGCFEHVNGNAVRAGRIRCFAIPEY